MKNFIQMGKSIEVTFGADVVSGEGVLIGDLFGIADHDVDVSVSAEGTLVTEGVFELAKDAADVYTQGLSVYWNAATKEATIDANGGANKLIGASIEALGAAAGVVKVRLNGTTVS